jgi:hypothetical protein
MVSVSMHEMTSALLTKGLLDCFAFQPVQPKAKTINPDMNKSFFICFFYLTNIS